MTVYSMLYQVSSS